MHLLGALPSIEYFPLAYIDHLWSGNSLLTLTGWGMGVGMVRVGGKRSLLLLNVQKGAIFLPIVYIAYGFWVVHVCT